MARYLISRLISLGLTLIAASLVIFAVLEIVPGDVASVMLGMNATDEALAALRDQLGLNQPLTCATSPGSPVFSLAIWVYPTPTKCRSPI